MDAHFTEGEVVRAVDHMSDIKWRSMTVLNYYLDVMIYDDFVINFRSAWDKLNHPYGKKDYVRLTGINVGGFDAEHRIKVTGFYKGTETRTWEEPYYQNSEDDNYDGGFLGNGPKGWNTKYETEEKVLEFSLNLPLWMINDPEKAKESFVNKVKEEKEKRELEDLIRRKKYHEETLIEIEKKLKGEK